MSGSWITKTLWLIMSVLVIVIVDQWIKELSSVWAALSLDWGWIKLISHENYGISFGIELPGQWASSLMVIFIVLLLSLFWTTSRYPFIHYLGLMFSLGGGVSNLIDRLTLGFVRDFMAVGFLPVFNLADIFIGVGVVLIVGGVFIGERISKA